MTDRPVPGQNATEFAAILATRHPAVQEVMGFFEFAHLPAHLTLVSQWCAILAEQMVRKLPDSAQLTKGLDDLLAAKDHFVRAAVKAAKG